MYMFCEVCVVGPTSCFQTVKWMCHLFGFFSLPSSPTVCLDNLGISSERASYWSRDNYLLVRDLLTVVSAFGDGMAMVFSFSRLFNQRIFFKLIVEFQNLFLFHEPLPLTKFIRKWRNPRGRDVFIFSWLVRPVMPIVTTRTLEKSTEMMESLSKMLLQDKTSGQNKSYTQLGLKHRSF